MERQLDRMNGMAVKVKGREKTGSAGGRSACGREGGTIGEEE